MILYITPTMFGRRDMGLFLKGSCLFTLLGHSFYKSFFSTAGTVLLVREISKRLEGTGEISGGQFSRTLAEMPSAPLAFDVSSLQSFLITILGQNCIEDNINLLGSWLYCRWNLAVSIEM